MNGLSAVHDRVILLKRVFLPFILAELVSQAPAGVIEEQECVGMLPEPEGLLVGLVPAPDCFVVISVMPAFPDPNLDP
jgi:hypothetical protein